MLLWEKGWNKMVNWIGQYYKREGIRTNTGKGQTSYRNRHSGEVRLGSPKGKVIGYERAHQHTYGSDPRGRSFKINPSRIIKRR